jgi:hypothetical protein
MKGRRDEDKKGSEAELKIRTKIIEKPKNAFFQKETINK